MTQHVKTTRACPILPRHEPRTVRQLLFESIDRHAGRDAILSPNRRALTYKDLGEQIEAVAQALAAAGLSRGRRVAVALPHGAEFAVAVLATCCAVTCAPLNDQLTEEALVGLLAAMRIEALIVMADLETNATRAARRLSIPRIELLAAPGVTAGAFELAAQYERPAVAAEPPGLGDIALLTHTSGTTGRPKVMPFEHWRMGESARNRVELAAILPTDRCLAVVPFHSTVAIRRGLLPALLTGSAVICPQALDAATLVTLLDTMRPTQLLAPPVVQIAMAEEFERRSPPPPHCLRFVTSAFTALENGVRRRIERTFGVPVTESYGMAECGSIADTPLAPRLAPSGSVGRAHTLDVAVVDDAGGFLDPGHPGEIVVRGPEVFSGYENDAEANRAAFREGWFRTGDAGRIDRDGFIYLVGRIKDLINRGGNKVSPTEVEDALRQHTAVAEAAAFAVPHPTLGEDVFAAVVPCDSRLTEGELRRFVRSRLAPVRQPTRILLMERLPRGTLGKVSRLELAGLARRLAAADLLSPRPGIETMLARIFAEVLEVPAVGRSGNFFHLGGDSMRAVRALVQIEAALGARIDMELLFDHPTVAELAEQISALNSNSRNP